MRYGLGQHGDLMPYSDFVKERPDVMPSTLANYRRYKSKKPAAGERLDIDTERGAFTALGGAVRGTSRGLHDPEIRIKGIPVSANATLGIAAGLGTVRAGADLLNSGASPSRDSGWFKDIRIQPYAQKITGDNGISQKGSRFVGDFKDTGKPKLRNELGSFDKKIRSPSKIGLNTKYRFKNNFSMSKNL